MNQIKLQLALAIAFAITAALGFAQLASAETGETAEAALERGKAAMKDGRITEACAAFAASAKIDPKIDTRLRLAKCYEQDGKLVAAARLFRDAADDDTDAARRQTSIAKAAKLEARAPKLRLALTSKPAGLVVKVDGVEVPWSEDVLVDLGPHEVIATAPGFAGRASAPVDREGRILDVIIRMEAVEAPAPATAPAPEPARAEPTPEKEASTTAITAMTKPKRSAPTSEPSKSHRKRNGIILSAGGTALLVGAIVLFRKSSDTFDEEQALCPMSKCKNDEDLGRARNLVSDSRTQRGLSIGMGIGAGLALTAGAYLLLTPSKEQMPVAINVDAHGAGVAYTFGF
jgi:hypothetical protein